MNNTKGKERRDNKSRRLCLLHKKDKEYLSKFAVVPHAGTWIEIWIKELAKNTIFLSFPTRERGLKLLGLGCTDQELVVVPHAGTWIEIAAKIERMQRMFVVPHAGTWIEIHVYQKSYSFALVVPHAGTWIEIASPVSMPASSSCRSPRGNVD